jgi:hypothetical protein
VKLHGSITVNGRAYSRGEDVPWGFIYPFFLIHMAAFGGSGFIMAYLADAPAEFLFMHGGIAIFVYLVFYLAIFGLDEVRWMFINAGLGIFGIVSQIDWILSLFGKHVGDYPWYVHVIPFMYWVLYTFLIRHAVVDLFGAREDEERRRRVEYGYVAVLVLIFPVTYLLGA